MGLSLLRTCIAVIFCILTMHCVSFVVLSPSLRRFHEKRPYQEGKISSLERVENWKIGGSNHHLPPPHPLLIDSLLSINDSCLPCGNNICLIRMFIWTDVWLHKKQAFEINVTTTRQTTLMKTQETVCQRWVWWGMVDGRFLTFFCSWVI